MMAQIGENHTGSKLTEADIRTIREQYGKPCQHCGARVTGAFLAKQYGVSSVMIHKIAHRQAWKNVDA